MQTLVIFNTNLCNSVNISDCCIANTPYFVPEATLLVQKGAVAITEDMEWCTIYDSTANGIETQLPIKSLAQAGYVSLVDLTMQTHGCEGARIRSLVTPLLQGLGIDYFRIYSEKRAGDKFIGGRTLKYYSVQNYVGKVELLRTLLEPHMIDVVQSGGVHSKHPWQRPSLTFFKRTL